MFQLMQIKYLQFLEHWKESGFLSACGFTLYKAEEAVPVEKDLSTLRPVKVPADASDLRLVEVTRENFVTLRLEYPLRSRHARADRYFRMGYRSFALVRGSQVLGDLWYSFPGGGSRIVHPHVQWFGLKIGEKDAYLFDMYMSPGERGKALTTFFLKSVLEELKKREFRRAYGYFAAQNIPALWVHRLIGYRELPRFRVFRYFLYESARAKG